MCVSKAVGLIEIGILLTPQDAPAVQAGLLCQAWENWQPEEDLFRVSETSCFLLSLGKETDGALPAHERYVCGYFNRGVHKNAVVLQLLVNTTAGIPWKNTSPVSLWNWLHWERKLSASPGNVPLCIKSLTRFLCTDRTARGVRISGPWAATSGPYHKTQPLENAIKPVDCFNIGIANIEAAVLQMSWHGTGYRVHTVFWSQYPSTLMGFTSTIL